MEKIKLLIGKDEFDSWKKADGSLNFGKVTQGYEKADTNNMYILIEAATMNEIIRIAYMAGYFKKDSILNTYR